MRRLYAVLAAVSICAFAGCQACCDATDYGPPVAYSTAAPYAGQPMYVDGGVPVVQPGTVIAPQQPVVVPAQ